MDILSAEHKLLILIGREPKRTKKKEMLNMFKRSSKIKNIFNYAIDPFKKYYIKQIPDNSLSKGQGVGEINDSTWKILDRLSNREVTGKDAKELLFAHMRDLLPSEAYLLRKIVLHKLGIGVAANTVNEIWPGTIIERFVQGAEDWDSGQLVLPAYSSLKLDGIRSDHKDGIFTTRSGHTICGLGHIKDDIADKGGGYYDGELVAPQLAHDFDFMSGYLRSDKPHKSMARYITFDNMAIPTLNQRQRLESLERIFPIYDFRVGPQNPPVSYLQHHLFYTEEAIMAFFSWALKQTTEWEPKGQEGLVIKHPRARYRAGKSYNWMKLKKGDSAEFIIVDWFEGEDAFKGMLGGVVVDVNGVLVKAGSGFSLKQRAEYWKDPKKYLLGQPATINFMEYNKNGSLRIPIFKNLRWDI